MYEFEVKNLRYGHCVQTVTRALQALDPRAEIQVDLRTQRVTVKSAAAESSLRAALMAADYPAS